VLAAKKSSPLMMYAPEIVPAQQNTHTHTHKQTKLKNRDKKKHEACDAPEIVLALECFSKN
jgi:hypothetical protein